MGKKVYTIPHRLNESLGTQKLIKEGLIEVIYDIDEFIESLGVQIKPQILDEVLLYCESNPSYDEAFAKYSNKIFEYELEGKIKVENGKIFVI
jgi:DNA processing protein